MINEDLYGTSGTTVSPEFKISEKYSQNVSTFEKLWEKTVDIKLKILASGDLQTLIFSYPFFLAMCNLLS